MNENQKELPNWLEYERLVAQIFHTISPKSEVRHNDEIEGFDSHIKRQIDVSIRFSEAGCNFLIIVQVKNFKRRANINVVDEFASVIKDVRATKGVLICNTGFTKAAKNLAISLGIDLMTAYDANNKDWRTTLTVPIVIKKITPYTNFKFEIFLEQGDQIPGDIDRWIISNDKGKTCLDIIGTFTKAWNNRTIPFEPGVHTILPANENLEMLVGPDKWRPLESFICEYFVVNEFFRKDVITTEFTGLKNLLNGNIEIQELNILLPKLDVSISQNGWEHVDKKWEDIINKENLLIRMDLPVILTGGATTAEFNAESEDHSYRITKQFP